MSQVCPECGAAAPWNAVPGKAYACPGCKNPVLAVERAEPAKAQATPPDEPPESEPAALDAPPATLSSPDAATEPPAPPEPEKKPWMMALLAFVVLGAAYVGVYSLLTAEARKERTGLLALPGGDTLSTAPDPGVAPSDEKGITAWKRAQERWSYRQKLEQVTKQIDMFFVGLVGAFLLQTALTAFVLVRLSHRTQRSPRERPPGPKARTSSSSRGARGPPS